VYDEYGVLVAVLDMGWEDIKLALDYEGDHHRSPIRFNKDIRRHDDVTELGWMDIRVTSRDTEGGIIARLTAEWRRRT
jgi:very-short-patch-repair endonuclease